MNTPTDMACGSCRYYANEACHVDPPRPGVKRQRVRHDPLDPAWRAQMQRSVAVLNGWIAVDGPYRDLDLATVRSHVGIVLSNLAYLDGMATSAIEFAQQHDARKTP